MWCGSHNKVIFIYIDLDVNTTYISYSFCNIHEICSSSSKSLLVYLLSLLSIIPLSTKVTMYTSISLWAFISRGDNITIESLYQEETI